MTIKYIITQINDNIIYSKYNNNGCLSLNIVDKAAWLVIYTLAELKMLLKTSALLLLKLKIKLNAITSLKIIRIIYFLIQRIIKLSTLVISF